MSSQDKMLALLGAFSVEAPVWSTEETSSPAPAWRRRKLVIADSFARYFLRNAINNGFPILVCDGISAAVQTGQRWR